jgi:alpha-ribazole phosphatase/probable phosphoglycerate mutase
MRLVLVRHGEPEASARGRCYGALDVGLSAIGQAQSERLGRALRSVDVAAIVSSPRRRAFETAAVVARPHSLDVRVESRLAELDFGELEGRTYDEIAAELPDLYAEWMTRPTEVRFPEGESYAELETRVLASVAQLREELGGLTVVAVTHGGVVRAVLRDALGLPRERVFRISVEPASVSIVEWLDREPIVRCVNARVGLSGD